MGSLELSPLPDRADWRVPKERLEGVKVSEVTTESGEAVKSQNVIPQRWKEAHGHRCDKTDRIKA